MFSVLKLCTVVCTVQDGRWQSVGNTGFSGNDFHVLNIVELRAKAHFSKRQLLESHLHIADYGVASFEGF